MKLRIASLTILCLALAAVPAWAGYGNGPINGSVDAWTINFGYVVSDTFTTPAGYYDEKVTDFSFGVWEFPGDTMYSVLWSVSFSPNPPNTRSVLDFGIATQKGGSGGTLTDRFISVNQYGYNIDLITVTGLNAPVGSGSTYWLSLQAATVSSGNPVYWDENSGMGCGSFGCPSSAFQNGIGTIPSEAFTVGIYGCSGCYCGPTLAAGCSLEPSGTPEPGSILLFGSGILGLAGLLRCKLNF